MIKRDDGKWSNKKISFPRLGMIKLGIKSKSPKGKEFPQEVDYFRFPEDEAGQRCVRAYGRDPKELVVFLPSIIEAEVFPQTYIWWGAGYPKCSGDGLIAQRMMDDKLQDYECLGEPEEGDDSRGCKEFKSGLCNKSASLLVILPKVALSGVFQIDTKSDNTVISVSSALRDIKNVAQQMGCEPG